MKNSQNMWILPLKSGAERHIIRNREILSLILRRNIRLPKELVNLCKTNT